MKATATASKTACHDDVREDSHQELQSSGSIEANSLTCTHSDNSRSTKPKSTQQTNDEDEAVHDYATSSSEVVAPHTTDFDEDKSLPGLYRQD